MSYVSSEPWGGGAPSSHLARPRAISAHRCFSRASDEHSAWSDPPAAESGGSARDRRAPDPHSTPSLSLFPGLTCAHDHARTHAHGAWWPGSGAKQTVHGQCLNNTDQGVVSSFVISRPPRAVLTGTLMGTRRGPRTHAPPRAAVPSATWCVGTRCAAALGFQISDCAITWRGGGGTTRGSLTHSARATCRPSLTQHVPRVGALSPVELDFVVSATGALDD